MAGSPVGDWLILEELRDARTPSHWQASDYKAAIDALSHLHERFWGLGEDLDAFPWLSRPLHADFEVHVAAAQKAIEKIITLGHPEPLAGAPERLQVLSKLASDAAHVVQPLRRVPSTLLHGDYWPGNIAVLEDGSQVVYDWQLAAVGPAMIDLLVFVTKSSWWFGDLPLSEAEIIQLYRQELEERVQIRWEDEEWAELWDHALMWRFLQEWVDLLAAAPDSVLETRAEELDQVWLDPVTSAVGKRLGMG